ncbi:hypothetical protein P389DRAFT_166923 [Cystobasidium minutum MCA 4210]|uniref:uncharacterized protein n=1 Tax=Cystobasidium minutum MCA 4210 TaxID=1397322 RepID=UPI0034CD4706|eukprot:jgi/Rhomi1/166923/fgenesh1_kg.2_\
MASLNSDKYAFLRMEAPSSYVAGLGRGASGFTTRSDIGPAREGPTSSEAAEALARGEKPGASAGNDEDDGDERYRDPDDETGLFAGTPYDQDDQEADNIYEAVEKKMDERRRARREKREAEEAEKERKERPPIQEQFADLKRGLADMSEDDWASLPEVVNLTGKRRKKMEDRFAGRSFVVPDSVIIGARDANTYESTLDEKQMNGGLVTPADGGLQNLAEIGEARNKVLGLSLDRMQESGTSTTIDPKGYLTDLDSVVTKSQAEIGDTKRARTLFASLIKSNPKHAPGWIAAASLESIDGRMVAARKLIAEGCQQCPKSEEIWLAAASLNTNENAKVILAQAVQHLPQSVNIWLAAADLEGDTSSKKRVLRKALEYIPTSVKLWKAAVSLEEQRSDARAMLARAVELIPTSIELWLTLARLEVPARARQVLNKARKAVPTSHEIWIAACRLQEQEGQADTVDALMGKAVAALKQNGVELPREEWLKEAAKCEANGSVAVCQAIIRHTIFLDVDEEDRYDKWIEDAEAMLDDGKVETARAIYAYALQVFPNRSSLWNRAADLERRHGSREAQLALLQRAVESCPTAEILWLKAAKEAWLGGDVPRARQILGDAFAANPDSEQIWLAAVKLEAENNELEAARRLMLRARTVAGTDRIWMKSAVFERQHSTLDEALNTVNEALVKFPTFDKLYMIKGQILQSKGDKSGARETYALGVKKCPNSVPLWILSARLEEESGLAIKARALLERARFHNKKSDEIWLESVRVEERAGNIAQAKSLMSRGLQECPVSGLLWSESVWMEARPARKTKMLDALKKANNDPLVVLTIARVFWSERKLDKARSWLEKAAAADPDQGEIWAWWLKFERQHGTKEQQEAVVEKCKLAEPKHGSIWQSVSKDPTHVGWSTTQILNEVASKLPEKPAP